MIKKVLLFSLIVLAPIANLLSIDDSDKNLSATIEEKKIVDDTTHEIPELNENSSTNQSSVKNAVHQGATISMKYAQEDLVEIINSIAALKNVNIMLPQGVNAITQKINTSWTEKFSIDQAWDRLYTILSVAGYSIIPRPNMYVIKKDSPDITRDALPIYIGTAPQELPNTDQRIRYVYYLSNIKLTDDPTSEVSVILTNLLPATTSLFKLDTTNNGLIISAKSNDIRAAMTIITSLDKTDFNESLETINLRYTTAKTIADLFNEKILKTGGSDVINRYHLSAKQQTEMAFFSKQTRLVAEDRTNTLFILGRPQATLRLKEFISKHIDVELESGRSILHVYQLQYSDAKLVAKVVDSIVKSSQSGTGQSRAGGLNATGSFMTLDSDIKITADSPEGDSPSGASGGNKIVVAARQSDWKIIEKLITELDKPQPQVFLEVLICDLSSDDSRLIGSMLRDPAKIPLPGTSQFQALNIGNDGVSGVTPVGAILSTGPTVINPTTSLKSDLLQEYYSVAGTTVSVDQLLTQDAIGDTLVGGLPGSTIISMNNSNGSTWGLLQILQSFDSTEIISHPHIIAINNQKALVSIGEQRVLPDEPVGSGGTTTTVKNKLINANLTVEITPRISTANTVQMQLVITIDQFLNASGSNPPRATRNVVTNALVKDKGILALGGLIQVNTTQTLKATPILSRIPIIGYLFKSRFNDIQKSNLTVFISPTIIMPRLHSGASDRTKEHIQLAKQYATQGELFDSLQDPITRWFFKTDDDAPNILDDFVERDEILSQQKKKNRRVARKKELEKKSKVTMAESSTAPAQVSLAQNDLETLIAHDTNPLLNA